MTTADRLFLADLAAELTLLATGRSVSVDHFMDLNDVDLRAELDLVERAARVADRRAAEVEEEAEWRHAEREATLMAPDVDADDLTWLLSDVD